MNVEIFHDESDYEALASALGDMQKIVEAHAYNPSHRVALRLLKRGNPFPIVVIGCFASTVDEELIPLQTALMNVWPKDARQPRLWQREHKVTKGLPAPNEATQQS